MKVSQILGGALLVTFMSHLAFAQVLGPYAHNNTVTPPDSGYINNVSLTANTPATINWPSGAAFVNVNCPSAYWTSLQSGPSVPNSTVTNGAGAALNTAQRQRSTGETAFYIVSSTSQVCSLEFWSN